MKQIFIALAAALIYIVFSPSHVLAFDSFAFYCAPYTQPFVEGHHYVLSDNINANCYFDIPSSIESGDWVAVAVYKGTVGNAHFLFGEQVNANYPIVQPYQIAGKGFTIFDGNTPTSPKQDDDFFAVVYKQSKWDINTGGPTVGSSPSDYQIVHFKWGAKPVSEYDPVIIIPGILGSWFNPLSNSWVIDPLKHTYDNLIDTLVANGYVKDKTLFTLPYDWEKSNVDTAKQLAAKIIQIKSVCNCTKVDLITHSMGGLVATQYIESADYKNDVDQFFMLGTPMTGAPKVYKAWESGEMEFADGSVNAFLNGIFAREALDQGYANVFSYIHQKPVSSVQELLPIFQNYLKLGTTILQFPTGYPTNPFLQNLVGDPAAYADKVLSKVQTYVVAGDTGIASTTVGFVVKKTTQALIWQDGEVVSNINGKGDGTVPELSSLYFSGPEKEVHGEHMDLPTLAAPYVFSQLTGGDPKIIVSDPHSSLLNPYYLVAIAKLAPLPQNFSGYLQTIHDAFIKDISGHSLLFITLFSPINVKITAPDGKQTGKDFAIGTSLSQIPNAVYSGPIGEHEYVVIEDPLPGQYKVETIGTGNGTYTVAAGRIDQATTTLSLVSGTTTLNQVISNTLFVSSTSTVVTLTPPPAPAATSTPTTIQITPDTCVADLALAYKNKWITKKAVFDTLTFDCKALITLFKTRDTLQKIANPKPAEKLLLAATLAAIKLDLADMDLLAKDKGNTKDAVSLITKYTTWFKNTQLH